MCGICGFFEMNNPSSLADAQHHLLAMCREMKHRGPDDQGTYLSEDGIRLGAVRLSILDLAGGHQPLSNEDGSCWVALNGEIYNFPELRKDLEQRGHVFRTHCDTEAVVHAYEEWGLDFLKHCHGMFALAIWDEPRQRLLVARDRLGKKPLYYTVSNRAFVFSSEIKSLLKFPGSRGSLDDEALDMYLTLGYIPGPSSIYQNIKKLMPGHFLVFDRDRGVQISSYWDIPLPEESPQRQMDQDAAAQKLLELLENSVKSRLLADVPVGVFLSGGLDSSLVTALMRKYKPDKLKSFSVVFKDPEQDESSYSKMVADRLGTEHYELATNHCPPDLIEKLVWHCDEPLADPAIVPTYLVSKLAKEQVTVVLTGEGADELFAGYFYYPLEKNVVDLDRYPVWFKQQVMVRSAKLVNKVLGRSRYHPRTLWSWQMQPAERVLAWMSYFTDEDKKRWFSPGLNATARQQHAVQAFRSTARKYSRENWLDHFSYIDLKIPLVDDLLMKVDKMSMAASLEARCPYLDHQVIEFSSGLPESMKLGNGSNKILLRQVAEKLLPREITHREKHGFDVPLRRWLSEDLKTYFWDMVSSQGFQKVDVISKPMVEAIWGDMQKDVPGSTRQVWNLMVLAAWCEQNIQ